MHISKLIKGLEELKKEYGDLEVGYCDNNGNSVFNTIDDVEYLSDKCSYLCLPTEIREPPFKFIGLT